MWYVLHVVFALPAFALQSGRATSPLSASLESADKRHTCTVVQFQLAFLAQLLGATISQACPYQFLSFFSFFFNIYLFIYYVYSSLLHVCLKTRRGRQISLQMVVSHPVVAGNWTQGLRKSSQCSLNLWAISPAPSRLSLMLRPPSP